MFLQRTLYLRRRAFRDHEEFATNTATDNERSSPLRTQLQLVGLENDMALKVGDRSPDFELPAIAGDRRIMMRSRDYLGRHHLIVAFHPLDWTPT